MRELGVESVAAVIRLLLDPTVKQEKREDAAFVLRGLRCREGIEPLIEVLAEGKQNLANACMWALVEIAQAAPAGRYFTRSGNSRRRAESLFIQVCGSLDTEEEYTRDMATEALGNTVRRLRIRLFGFGVRSFVLKDEGTSMSGTEEHQERSGSSTSG